MIRTPMSHEGDPAPETGAPPDRPGRISGLVVARGAATGLLLAMPAAFASGVLSDRTPKPKGAINVAFLVVVLGFFLAGWLAGREAPSRPAKHGALAAFVAFLPVEVVAILARLDRGDSVGLGGIIFVGLLAACAGSAGAQLGVRRSSRRENP